MKYIIKEYNNMKYEIAQYVSYEEQHCRRDRW
jgi:hypothetical protein